jgi:transposase
MVVFVRELTAAEGQHLTRILKTSRDGVMLRRAQVVALSGQRMRARQIAAMLHLHEEYVRELIRRFNEGSFEALKRRKPTGRPSKYEPEEISAIVEIAQARPRDFGLPFTVWSLRKLTGFLLRRGFVRELVPSTLGRLLEKEGITFQRTKTWKESNDPDFVAKKNASRRSTKKRRRTAR